MVQAPRQMNQCDEKSLLVLPSPRLLELDRGLVARRTVRASVIPLVTPVLKEHLRFERRLERFDVTVRPW